MVFQEDLSFLLVLISGNKISNIKTFHLLKWEDGHLNILCLPSEFYSLSFHSLRQSLLMTLLWVTNVLGPVQLIKEWSSSNPQFPSFFQVLQNILLPLQTSLSRLPVCAPVWSLPITINLITSTDFKSAPLLISQWILRNILIFWFYV